jgi:pimeloyl-ACP methyl ester carboxylesterase
LTGTRVRRLLAVSCVVFASAAGSASASLKVSWMPGFAAPRTPAKFDRVGVIKVGPSSAKNVLVLEPGTLAGGAYFVPLAEWIVAHANGWQVWSIERRENLLEDHSELNLAKPGKSSAKALFDYYLGFLKDSSIKHHFQFIPDSSVEFAKQWGIRVAVEDLHRVIKTARKLGGHVVLGGHSLGGQVLTAYATWDFSGRAGAADLAGLVYIDGGSGPAVSASQASKDLHHLDDSQTSPWLTFGGIGAPFAGLFNSTGSTAALIDPNGRSLGQQSGLLTPFHLSPSVPVTNLAQYGYALNVKTSPMTLLAAQAHLGQGLAAHGSPRGWNGAGALTPLKRYAQMFSGTGLNGTDGTEWYFPARLTLDTEAVGGGVANPAQAVLDVHATMARHLPKDLLIYAFGARLGGSRVLDAARLLARKSNIPAGNLTLINRQSSYAHNDPIGAYPHNVFFANLLRFLGTISTRR